MDLEGWSVGGRGFSFLSKLMVPVIALAGLAFVFAGGWTLLLGYALVTQLFLGSRSRAG